MRKFKAPNFTIQELRECLQYEPRTGRWFWLKPHGKAPFKTGQETALQNKKGNRLIAFRTKQYQASRLAWFYMTGKWPQLYVDHKNNIHTDDRWCNLRLATHGLNRANSKTSSKIGYKGVIKDGNRFIATCKRQYLGMFATAKLAHAAYIKAAKKHFGEFARYD